MSNGEDRAKLLESWGEMERQVRELTWVLKNTPESLQRSFKKKTVQESWNTQFYRTKRMLNELSVETKDYIEDNL